MKNHEESIGFQLIEAARLMRREFQEQMSGGPLTPSQARVLFHIARFEGLRQVDLAERLEIQPMSLARLIDPLEKALLIQRKTDPSDRRAYLLHLGLNAQNTLKELEKIAECCREQAFSGISEEERQMTLRVLKQIRRNLSPASPSHLPESGVSL